MNAKAIANYLLYIMSDAFDDVTNMKINKLLYFAQGHYLKKYGKPLFYDSIEAWEHGPVVPSVYNVYKAFGDRPITRCDENVIVDMQPDIEELLFDVARNYGRYTAGALRNMTHVVGSPWDQVYDAKKAHVEIPIGTIRDYFASADDIKPVEKHFKDTDFIGYRDEDGILVLPKEWDDEAV